MVIIYLFKNYVNWARQFNNEQTVFGISQCSYYITLCSHHIFRCSHPMWEFLGSLGCQNNQKWWYCLDNRIIACCTLNIKKRIFCKICFRQNYTIIIESYSKSWVVYKIAVKPKIEKYIINASSFCFVVDTFWCC